MNPRKTPSQALLAFILCGMVLTGGSCRRGNGESEGEAVAPPPVAPELQSNQLGDLPGAVYHSQADSPIHWQPWTKDSLERARAARRLVFCVIAMPQQPGFLKVLSALDSDVATVEAINNHYVPILVDGDASREMGLLTADLCAEIQRPLQLPLFVWMTYEGNPVAWIPVSASGEGGEVEVFNQSHTMVSQMWEDDVRAIGEDGSSGYVLKNSALDNANRRSRFEQRKVSKVTSEQPAVDAIRALRQLASLYDPYSRSFDEAGGLFPTSSLELLATAAVRPGLPPELRVRCLETTGDLLKDLLPSAMFDPLDGGVFSSRRGLSWAFPSFVRDCPGQAKVAVSLLAAYRATGDGMALDRALDVISFAEKSYATPEGLFAMGLTREPDPEEWMWSVEEIEIALGPEDAAWWIEATRMKGLGNLPSEADPRREYFRGNTVGLGKSVAEIAAGLSLPVESFRPRFEAVRDKLLAIRNERLGSPVRDVHPHPGASMRMVSAYASAFTVTGDEAFRKKAIALLTRVREAFAEGPRLRAFAEEQPASIGAGRAFLYALALQSTLDVASITGDDTWMVWAEDLATTAAEMFTGNGFLKECPDEAKLIDLPVSDLVMLFDDSTAGLVSMAEARLAKLGRPLVASFSELAIPLPTYAMDRPILHTDLLFATLNRHYGITVLTGADLPASLKTAVLRMSPRSVQHRPAKAAEDVPAGSVKVMLPEDSNAIVSNPGELNEALLPSAAK
jgi:uncharacterized protein